MVILMSNRVVLDSQVFVAFCSCSRREGSALAALEGVVTWIATSTLSAVTPVAFTTNPTIELVVWASTEKEAGVAKEPNASIGKRGGGGGGDGGNGKENWR